MRRALLTGTSLLSLAALGLFAAGPATGRTEHAARAQGIGGVVSVVGKVGPLTFDMSSAVTVQAFAGRAAFIGTGTFSVPGKPNFTALGYGCSAKPSPLRVDPTAYRPSHTYCRTVFYVSDKTDRLAAFWTSSPAFRTKYGTHPGSSQSYANTHEDALPEFGCHRGLSRETANAELLMDNHGGHARTTVVGGVTYTTAVVGGTINDFALASNINDIGLLFC